MDWYFKIRIRFFENTYFFSSITLNFEFYGEFFAICSTGHLAVFLNFYCVYLFAVTFFVFFSHSPKVTHNCEACLLTYCDSHLPSCVRLACWRSFAVFHPSQKNEKWKHFRCWFHQSVIVLVKILYNHFEDSLLTSFLFFLFLFSSWSRYLLK